MRLTQARLDGGIAPRTDLRQAEQVLATARQATSRSNAPRCAQDAICSSCWSARRSIRRNLPASIEQAAPTIAALPAGLDSRVLLRRPDVVQAEYQLRAANADIGAARAALFPTISLTGLLGFASSALGSLFTGGAFAWSAGAGRQLFDFPRRRRPRQRRAHRGAARRRAGGLRKAIQTAFREVADALAERGTLDERLPRRHANAAAAADTRGWPTRATRVASTAI